MGVVRLFDNPNYISYGDVAYVGLIEVFKNGFMYALSGNSTEFFYNFDAYLNACVDVKSKASNLGAQMISNLIATNKLKVKEDIVNALSDDYCALYSFLENDVFVAIDTEKEDFDAVLVTRNQHVLTTLKSNGMLSPDTDLAKIQDAMTGNKTALGFKDEEHCVIRLEVDRVQRDKVIFKASIPRSRFAIGVGRQYFLIPITFMYVAEDLIREHLGSRPFRFYKTSVNGSVNHIASISNDIVKQVYTECDANDVEAKLRKTKVGFDIASLRFVAFDLEAPVEYKGAATFRFHMLDRIYPVGLNEVNKSQHNVNYDMLTGVFKTKVKSFKVADFGKFTIFDTSSFATREDKEKALIAWGESTSGRDLYNFMSQYPDLFGDVQDALQTRMRVSPKFLKALKEVDLSDDKDEKKSQVLKMLDNGIVKLTVYSKRKGIYDVLCSNNRLVLSRMLGKDYIAKMESPRYRLYAIKDMIRDGEIRTREDLEKAASDYGILSYVDGVQLLDKAINRGNADAANGALDKAISELDEKNYNRNESMILYKKVYADAPDNLYGQVNVDNIISAEYCGVAQKSKK